MKSWRYRLRSHPVAIAWRFVLAAFGSGAENRSRLNIARRGLIVQAHSPEALRRVTNDGYLWLGEHLQALGRQRRNSADLKHLGGRLLRGGVLRPITPVVVRDGRMVFVADLVPMRDGAPAAPDIAGQTEYTLDLLEQRLAEAGSTPADLLRTTVWPTVAACYPAFNARDSEGLAGLQPPSRSAVASALIAPVRIEIEIEIEAVAVRPRSG